MGSPGRPLRCDRDDDPRCPNKMRGKAEAPSQDELQPRARLLLLVRTATNRGKSANGNGVCTRSKRRRRI